jgi:hypothetical protein
MADYDSPWKEALDAYFESFMAFFFPDAHAEIDWTRGHEALDKELQKIVPEGELGRRFVDKLVKIWLRDGAEQWLLIHVEVQTDEETGFSKRMYIYNYRLFDKYNREVVSLAILADDNPRWRPDGYSHARWGFLAGIRFPAVKLLDYAGEVEWLENHSNPFATVVLAHLKTRETSGNQEERYSWKTRLIKGLYDRGMNAVDIRRLFRFIDWIMELPKELEIAFWDRVRQYEEEKHMPFMTTPERVGMRKAFRTGIEEALDIRFGEQGLRLMPEIEEVYEVERLEAILKAIKTVASPDELRRLWAK